MKKVILLIMVSALCLGQTFAQKRRTRNVPKKVVVEKSPQQKLYDELLPSTAKIMFIDSVVVDKSHFLTQIRMPQSLGEISEHNGTNGYTNEFENKRIYAQGDTITGRHLYISHRYGDKWEEPRKISEIDNEMPDYPFLMSDGVTLYFSAEGEGTVGGRDIFRTVFNNEDSRFYEAANIGLPYNSPANEYMMALSDIDNIGWLVSDRNQPEGKVCIYIFETTAQRQTMGDDTDEETMKRFAEIASIKETWAFGNREDAMDRLNAMMTNSKKNVEQNQFEFVVDDQKTYTSLSDFKKPDAKKIFLQMTSDRKKRDQLAKLLEDARTNYLRASKAKKYEIGRQIAELENDIDILEDSICKKEKEIRKIELN